MPSSATSLPPPTGGWDTRESLADMPIDHSIICDNFFPSTDKVTVRRGTRTHVSGIDGPIETLIEYISTSGEGSLFASSPTDIYDVTNSGEVGEPVVANVLRGRWQQARMGTAAGNFLRIVNGVDVSLVYDGTNWSPEPAVTGIENVEELDWINSHQNRMWFGKKDSLFAYYLPVSSIGGEATAFNLSGIAKLGGFIMAMGTWTRDAGDGMDDVAVFLTSEGEAIVYQGTDPSSPNTWSLIGVFRIGKPIGRRCFVQGGPDLILITQDGFVPLSSILSIDRSQVKNVALSGQISKAVNDEVRLHRDFFGWQPILYPFGTMLIFNIPQSSSKSYQFVFNTITGAPCRFTGINALCFSLLEDNIYYGSSDGNVNQFDIGSDDINEAIQSDCLQAFSYFGSKGRKKIFKQVELIFEGNGQPSLEVNVELDFNFSNQSPINSRESLSQTVWGIATWGEGLWASRVQVYNGWRGIRGLGRAAALRVRIGTRAPNAAWTSSNIIYQLAGKL